jgi:hypothetical protein
MKSFLWQRKNWFIALSLLFLLALSLAACGNNGNGTSAGSGNATPTVTAVSTPSVNANPGSDKDPCKDPSYWNSIVGLHAGQAVESVSCGKVIGTDARLAVVDVRNVGEDELLDVHFYRNITSTHPQELFELTGLVHGDARVSLVNTLITAEVDKNSSINKGKPEGQLTQDLFREFKWPDGAGTLVRTAFPGFYPDLTRYQAEADQARFKDADQSWKLDAIATVKHFMVALLKFPANSTVKLISGGGEHDLQAVVNVTYPSFQGCCTFPPNKVTLNRLEGNAQDGIWIVTAVTSESLSITLPHSGEMLMSPATVTGSGSSFEGQVGTVYILDHLYNTVGSVRAIISNPGSFVGPFSASVPYTVSFNSGVQDGIVLLNNNGGTGLGAITEVVMVKVLLTATSPCGACQAP